MPETRCPKCGKINPAAAEICRFCQTRLKPAAPPNPPAAPTPPADSSTDWLHGLLDGTADPEAASQPPEIPAPAEPGQMPDWLSRIRQRSKDEQDAVSKIGKAPDLSAATPDDQPAPADDWLSSLSDQPGVSAGNAGDVTAWLNSLGSDEPPTPPAAAKIPPAAAPSAPPAQPAEEADDAAWLANLTASMGGEKMPWEQPAAAAPTVPADAAASEEPLQANNDLPEWLSSLKPAEPSAPAGLPPAPAAEEEPLQANTDLPDWLRSLEPAEPEPAAPAEVQPEPASQEPASSGAGLTGWLRSLEPAEPEPAAPAAETPPAPANEVPASSGAGLDGWLRSLEPAEPELAAAAAETPIAPVAEEPSASGTGITGWLRSLEPAEPEPAAPAAEPSPAPASQEPTSGGTGLTGWLLSLEAAEPEPAAPAAEAQPAPEPASAEENLPEWLKNLEPPAPSQPTGDVPEWLKGASEPADEPLAQPEPAQPAEVFGEMALDAPVQFTPESFGSAFDEQPPAETPAPGEEPAAVPADIPDWLSQFAAEPAAAEPGAPEPLNETPPGDVPDWLSQFPAAAPPAPAGLAPSGEPTPPAETPDWLSAFSAGGELPSQELPLQQESPAEEPTAFAAEDLPEWLKAAPVESGAQAQPAAETDFAHNDINELLAGVSSEQESAPESAAEAPPLEPAQLPSWLQAMRPVESAVAATPAAAVEDDQRVERSGPLAGLRGVLPGEDLVSQYRKPPIYTNKLQVSEKQRLHAGLLQTLLGEEGQAHPAASEPTTAPQFFLRLVTALLLIVLIVLPPLVGFQMPAPTGLAASQPELKAAFDAVAALQPGANVLLVADYEAGLHGEMKAAALPLLRHLQTRQPRLALTSTLPAGPLLAEQLSKDIGSSAAVNLGYLAGGSSALKLLAVRASLSSPAPIRLALPFPYNRDWSSPLLQNLRDLNSFQRIILLTDSVENARGWMEQVRPALDPQTVLLVVSSAQAAPLVQAYAASGQAAGLVSGIQGGLAYEQLTRQPGSAGAWWTGYQLSMLLVVILIVVGGLAGGISTLFQRRKTNRKA